MAESIMEKKFKLKDLLSDFYDEVEKINSTNLTPGELSSKKNYLNAIADVRGTGILDTVKYAVSFGRQLTGQSQKFHQALPTLVMYRVAQPNKADKLYADILYRYAVAFDHNRKNLKDLILNFVINNNLSPVKSFIDKELQNVITRADRIRQD